MLRDKVSVYPISRDVADKIISENHYAGILGPVSYTLGIYYKEDHPFYDDYTNLIGAIAYARPLGRLAVKSISEDLEAHQSLELTRLWIADSYPKNIESYSIGQSFRWIRNNLPEVEVLLSYSDPSYNHLGTIYQATNWLYQGQGFSIMDKYRISLTNDPYDWIHHRTIYDLYGSVGLEQLKKSIGKTFWMKRESNKHRYIYFLKRKRYWMKRLKYPILPYPKMLEIQNDEIVEVTV